MPTVDYLPIATTGSPNVDTQGDFVGSGYQTEGFTTGLAQSKQLNKCWRQSSMFTAAWANIVSSVLSISVLDDGNLSALIANILACLSSLISIALEANNPTTVFLQGSAGGNYVSGSSFADVDGTNLVASLVIPVGWKLLVRASGTEFASTGNMSGQIALFDGGTQLATAGISVASGGVSQDSPFALDWVIIGDGATHAISLQFKTGGGSASQLEILNSGSTVPTMVLFLTPSN